MEILFDTRGFLKATEPIEMQKKDIEQYFIEAFPNETTRQYLWAELQRYLDDFSNIITPDFECWIDGSFVTKKWSPQDIDLIISLDYEQFEKKETLLRAQFVQPKLSDVYKGIDVYILKKYPEYHLKYSHYCSDTVYWQYLFSHTKPNRNQKTFSKGFIKLLSKNGSKK